MKNRKLIHALWTGASILVILSMTLLTLGPSFF